MYTYSISLTLHVKNFKAFAKIFSTNLLKVILLSRCVFATKFQKIAILQKNFDSRNLSTTQYIHISVIHPFTTCTLFLSNRSGTDISECLIDLLKGFEVNVSYNNSYKACYNLQIGRISSALLPSFRKPSSPNCKRGI